MKRHSGLGQAAYSDLLRLLKDEDVSEIRGTPERKTVNGRRYWYDRVRVGTSVKSRYIGEDTEDLRARIDRHCDLTKDRAERLKERGRLVRVLRSEGYTVMDDDTGPLLGAMARLGVFRLGGTLVGTHALRLFGGELGRRFPADEIAMTQDVDTAQFQHLSFALQDQVEPSLQQAFKALEFRELPAVDTTSTWRWQQGSGATTVEFLTASFEEEEGVCPLPALGVSARALHYLNFLLAAPVQAAVIYRHGVLVQIPRPERYAIHKRSSPIGACRVKPPTRL